MAASNGSKVTNDTLFTQIDRVRVELKGDIIRLEGKFDNLEAGRLTRLEQQVNQQQVYQATSSTKLAIIGFIAASIIGAIISVVVPRLIR
jgi:hypothetical protein